MTLKAATGDFVTPEGSNRGVDWSILIAVIPLTDIAAIYGSQAQTLHLPTSSLTPFAPIFMIVGWLACQFCFGRTWIGRHRQGIAAAVIAFFGFHPVVLLEAFSISLQLERPLETAEVQQLRAVFPHPFVEYSGSGVGWKLLICRRDRAESLMAFLSSIHAIRKS